MHPILILNEKAGTVAGDGKDTGASSDDVVEAFAATGHPVTLQRPGSGGLAEALRAAVALRPPAIFVGGGDGTIATAAGLLAGTGIPLGVLPLGTLNHFARDLGLPADWREAVTALVAAPARDIDVGEVNGHVFINNCSLGLYAEAVRERDALRAEQGHGKWWAMFLASVAVFRRLRRIWVRIETSDGVVALRTPFVFVGNNRYDGRIFNSHLRPRLDEARLWIYTTRAHGHFLALRLMLQALRRRLHDVDHLDPRPVTEATITPAHGDIPIAADGELVTLRPPLRFRIRPRALRVLMPVAAAKP